MSLSESCGRSSTLRNCGVLILAVATQQHDFFRLSGRVLDDDDAVPLQTGQPCRSRTLRRRGRAVRAHLVRPRAPSTRSWRPSR
eukprot:COSAG06_NODE_9300_length_1933_cov_1.755180_4_plen_84_part_00